MNPSPRRDAPLFRLPSFLHLTLSLTCLSPHAHAGAGPPAGVMSNFGPNTVFAVDTGNNLRRFQVATPGRIEATVAINGLKAGENILAIDIRPSNGLLYGLGSTSQIYLINALTGGASPVGGSFTPALSGTDFGFDFNPMADRIRIVSDTEQNLRVHPDTGTMSAVDSLLNPAGNVVASAYTNNFAGAATTTLYGLDSTSDRLVTQAPPNNGTLATVGFLGVNTSGLTGFDIAPGSNTAYASLTAPGASNSGFYTVNLTTGEATLIGTIATGVPVRGIAVAAGPDRLFALTSGNKLISFESTAPSVILSSTTVTGLRPGENLLGMDLRPANGLLYGLGSTSRLYQIDVNTAVATQIGSGIFTPPLDGTNFGFDFNPLVDRIRVVSDTEQNLRLDPNNATVTSADAPLNPAGQVVAAAYSNNFAGSAATTLYDIDASTDQLMIQSPPNNGNLTAVGPLGTNTGGLAGLDISAGGRAYAALTAPLSTVSQLYTIDLATGAATLVGAIGGGETIRDLTALNVTEVIYGITQPVAGSHNLIAFNAATPGAMMSAVTIAGLQPGESIRGFDARPATGQLYAIGSTSRVYIINSFTGVAAAVGAPFSPVLNGTVFGVDFNPVADRIRVVSNTGQNLRLNPATGGMTASDVALNPPGNIVAAAYTNSYFAASGTTLYDIDATTDSLVIQNPPNNGTLVTVGPLGPNIGNNTAFDISVGTGIAYLSAYPTALQSPYLYAVDLTTGTAALIGAINIADTLLGITVVRSPGAMEYSLAPLRITTVLRLPNGRVQLQGTGIAAGVHTIERSTDLTAFSFLASVTADSDGLIQFEDTTATGLPEAFYRLRIP